MLRALEEHGGIGVYTENLVRELLDHDGANEYVLLYRERASLGHFGERPNVRERHLRAPGTAFWDQLAVPRACRQEAVDVLLHPKFTVPLLSPCPAVMVVHGADWFIPEQARFYGRLDVRYVRAVMPLYFRRAAAVISVSRLTTENFRAVLPSWGHKLHTIYFAPSHAFDDAPQPAEILDVQRRYGLPAEFLFTLTKLRGGERKNLGGLVAAYARYHAVADDPLPLVVGGLDCEQLRSVYDIPEDGWGRDVLFPGWIDQQDLPAIYGSARLFLYPSNLEAFPIPLTEAMACGTPIVTSDVNGLDEIAGEAAIRVPPDDPERIAEAIARVAGDAALRATLRERGRERSQRFSWDRCARETLAVLRDAARTGR
jgi:glycosyltransferase involved in cell wall biosynthesis